MARRYPRFSAERWVEYIFEQQASNTPVDVFFSRNGVGVSTFAKWRRRPQGESYTAVPEPIHGTRGFVEAIAPTNQVVSLVLSDGARLELPVVLGSE